MDEIIPPGPYPEFGQNRWVFDAYPYIVGVFIQDKFEKESLIINAGFRLDWFMPGETIFDEDYKKAWENATGLKADWNKIKYKISPRFGISFPISEKSVLFFSYGHFNQLPELQFFYRDPYTGSLTGNPHLDYEQTVLYEFGFTNQLFTDWALDIKSYAKDISGQVGTTHLLANLGIPVELYDNKGYARARGIEVELTKRYSNFISGKVSYTAQWATGYSSSAFEDYIKSINDFPLPIRERPTEWDVRHQVILQAALVSPRDYPLRLFGFSLSDDWLISVLSRFASGQPYTPGSYDPAELQIKENTFSATSTMSTDLKVKKTFDLGMVDLSFYIDIFNLFNQNNVQLKYGFNNWTGQPYKYGDINPETLSNEYKEYLSYSEMVRLRNPRQIAQTRYSRIGMSVNF
jgi:outer membrane receptor protein involved in Fe transport